MGRYSLTQTLGGQSYRGTLDAAGEATVSLPIPSSTSLVGQTIYSRVVIEQPGEPGDIWTLSSLGVTEIIL